MTRIVFGKREISPVYDIYEEGENVTRGSPLIISSDLSHFRLVRTRSFNALSWEKICMILLLYRLK
jgi:hypothetical protein